MRLQGATLVVILTLGGSAIAQRPLNPTTQVPRLDLSAGFQHLDANAPPGGCKCFGLNGGYVSGTFHLSQSLGIKGEFQGGHANNISSLGQNLTLMTYTVGPQVSFRRHRLVPYAEALFGSAHASDSYFPTVTSYTTTATSFAFSAGGGADYNLSPRFAVRLIDAQYLHTGLPNAANNSQNHLMLSAGFTVKIRGFRHHAEEASATTPSRIYLNCNVRNTDVTQGQVLDVSAKARPEPGKGDVAFAWTSSGGNVQGSGPHLTVATANLAPGDYSVNGHVTLVGNADVTADCDVPFRVLAAVRPRTETLFVPIPTAAMPPPPSNDEAERVFHTNVPDALFDYDKWAIRPDAHTAIEQAGSYLNDHKSIRVLVGGYSDERGTTEYNIALGLKRANATRDQLVAMGVAPERIQVVSYGKGAQVCTERDEACYQQNRRAAFSLHP